jgi:hypothetical protein
MVDTADDLRAFLADRSNRRLELGPGGEVEQLEVFSPDELEEEAFTFLDPAPSFVQDAGFGVFLVPSARCARSAREA